MASVAADRIEVTLEAKTTKFQRNMDKAAAKVEKTGKKMAASTKKGSKSFEKLGQSVRLVEGPLGGVAGRFATLNSIMSKSSLGMIGFTVAMAGLAAVMRTSIRAFSDHERVQGRLAAIIKSTGQAAGISAAEIDQFAISLGKSTLTSRNAVNEAAAVLLTFKSIGRESFFAIIEVAQDLSEILGTDLKSSILQLGKAFEDPNTQMATLRRSGVTLGAGLERNIRQMQAMGNIAGAQTLLLKALQDQIGGAGAGAAGGVAGSLDTFSESWTNLMVTLGNSRVTSDALKMIENIAGVLQRLDVFFGGGPNELVVELKGFGTKGGFKTLDELFAIKDDVVLQRLTASARELLQLELALQELRSGGGIRRADIPPIKPLEAIDVGLSAAAQKTVDALNQQSDAVGRNVKELARRDALLKAELISTVKLPDAISATTITYDAVTRALSNNEQAVVSAADAMSDAKVRAEEMAEINKILLGDLKNITAATDKYTATQNAIVAGLEDQIATTALLVSQDGDLSAAAREANLMLELRLQLLRATGRETFENEKVIRAMVAALVSEEIALERVNSQLAQFARDSDDTFELLQSAGVRALQSLEDKLLDVINGAENAGDAFKSFAKIVIEEIQRILIAKTITGPLSKFLDIAIKSFFPSIGPSIPGAVPGPHLAKGGPVVGGHPIIVGEKGPEFFVPSTTGTIIPNPNTKKLLAMMRRGEIPGFAGGGESGGTAGGGVGGTGTGGGNDPAGGPSGGQSGGTRAGPSKSAGGLRGQGFGPPSRPGTSPSETGQARSKALAGKTQGLGIAGIAEPATTGPAPSINALAKFAALRVTAIQEQAEAVAIAAFHAEKNLGVVTEEDISRVQRTTFAAALVGVPKAVSMAARAFGFSVPDDDEGGGPNDPAGDRGRALGGGILGGQSKLVGELGPEVFVPAQRSSSSGRGGGTSISKSIAITVAPNFALGVQSTVRVEVMQMLPQITEVVKAAVFASMQQGGVESRIAALKK